MHTLPVFDIHGKEKGRLTLPRTFSEKVRPDLIKRAVLAEMSELRQPYGTDPLAGQRTSAHYHGRRRDRFSMMNRELARLPRIHGQGYLNFTARLVPHAVKGRRAHPPRAEKIWKLKINRKEKIKALISALAATADKELVSKRGHKIGGARHVPLVIDDEFQKLKKTKDVIKVLEKFGLLEELDRCKERTLRPGKGKMRGRRYKNKRGPLVIIDKDDGVAKALKNIPGIDVALPNELTVSLLAPGTHPGRFTIFTKSAIKKLGEWYG